MIPQTTTPLTKLIRTTEGWLVIASNILLVVLGSVQDMQWAKVGTAAAVLNGATMIARQALKAVAAAKPFTGDPIIPQGFDAPVFDGGNTSSVTAEPGSEA